MEDGTQTEVMIEQLNQYSDQIIQPTYHPAISYPAKYSESGSNIIMQVLGVPTISKNFAGNNNKEFLFKMSIASLY